MEWNTIFFGSPFVGRHRRSADGEPDANDVLLLWMPADFLLHDSEQHLRPASRDVFGYGRSHHVDVLEPRVLIAKEVRELQVVGRTELQPPTGRGVRDESVRILSPHDPRFPESLFHLPQDLADGVALAEELADRCESFHSIQLDLDVRVHLEVGLDVVLSAAGARNRPLDLVLNRGTRARLLRHPRLLSLWRGPRRRRAGLAPRDHSYYTFRSAASPSGETTLTFWIIRRTVRIQPHSLSIL
jgi:hypothetical protein